MMYVPLSGHLRGFPPSRAGLVPASSMPDATVLSLWVIRQCRVTKAKQGGAIQSSRLRAEGTGGNPAKMLENLFWVWGAVYKTSRLSPNPHRQSQLLQGGPCSGVHEAPHPQASLICNLLCWLVGFLFHLPLPSLPQDTVSGSEAGCPEAYR